MAMGPTLLQDLHIGHGRGFVVLTLIMCTVSSAGIFEVVGLQTQQCTWLWMWQLLVKFGDLNFLEGTSFGSSEGKKRML